MDHRSNKVEFSSTCVFNFVEHLIVFSNIPSKTTANILFLYTHLAQKLMPKPTLQKHFSVELVYISPFSIEVNFHYKYIYLSLTTVAIIIKIDAARQIVLQILLHFEFTTIFRITLQNIDWQYYYYYYYY